MFVVHRDQSRNLQRSRPSTIALKMHWQEAEYKEIVDVLGFDPKKISSEDFSQAWGMAQILWEDERCQTLLTRFARDYTKAQHSLEISELAGSAAFEILGAFTGWLL